MHEKWVHLEMRQNTGTELMEINANLLRNNGLLLLNIHPVG